MEAVRRQASAGPIEVDSGGVGYVALADTVWPLRDDLRTSTSTPWRLTVPWRPGARSAAWPPETEVAPSPRGTSEVAL